MRGSVMARASYSPSPRVAQRACNRRYLLNFLAAWGEYLFARILVGGNEALLTWPLGMARFQAQFSTQWADLSAAAIMVSVPIVFLFVYISKYLVSGLTLGGVKG